MDAIKLKNGAEELDVLVTDAMLSLRNLIRERPTAFYDLVMACRDKDYQPFGNNADFLRDRELYPIHDSIRNIVLSAAEGDGLEMKLVSPLAEQAE